MDKDDVIKEVYEERKKASEEDFRSEVKGLVWEIEETSNKLRDLKKRLSELQYKEPEIVADILKK